MKFIDLTMILYNRMPVFPGDPEVRITKSHDSNHLVCKLETGLHAGTHIDAPLHFKCSDKTVADIDLPQLMGSGFLIEDGISDAKGEVAVIRTGWSSMWGRRSYFKNYPFISMKLAEELVDMKIKGVCIESPSVDRPGESRIHELLLGEGVWIAENIINTYQLPESFNIHAIPLAIKAEAAPARVFASLND